MKLICPQMENLNFIVFLLVLTPCLYCNINIGETNEKCNNLEIRETNITTSDVFVKFDLWVFIVPHSHNDPGWLSTYLQYYEIYTRDILNSVTYKMTEYRDMTFIWSEICFLQLWWDEASLEQRLSLKKLIDSGRFEITTGGWVMTDEANVHVYPMIDQLIEGHQWIKTHLKTKPTFGWSVDSFGHGATVPYLLAGSGFDGTIIQRIHFAWKEWFAKHQNGDFIWQPFWKSSNKNNLLTHNMPFHLYTTEEACGPFKNVCLEFDFRFKMINNTDYAAKLLFEQYARTASLFSHNVALIPIGHDFSFRSKDEIDQQYSNYKKLIDYINNNKQYFNAEISFGTPKDYFREIKKRTDEFPTLKGDFFVYADIQDTALDPPNPRYWSGYFSTRPFYKILGNELEHNLRSCEILFTLAYNIVRQNRYNNLIKLLENGYKNLILARRNLGLFQHHDAITGTAKSHVMEDYGNRIYRSIKDCIQLQESTVEIVLQKNIFRSRFLLSILKNLDFSILPDSNYLVIVIFNSLTQKRMEMISIRTSTPHVSIMNENGLHVKIQINPVFYITHNSDLNNITISSHEYEILFLVELPPISILTFRLMVIDKNNNNLTTVYCKNCVVNNTRIEGMKIMQNIPHNIQLENSKMKLLFNNKSGFLESVIRKNDGFIRKCAIIFAAYKSVQNSPDTHPFKKFGEQENAEINILYDYSNEILITSGPLSSDITVVYGPFLTHTVRIFHTDTYLGNAIHVVNEVNYGDMPRHSNEELFMRLVTKIDNGPIPEFYSDQNGFQFQRRVNVPSIGFESNYFPITSAAFIQDKMVRLTLLTAHSQGAASLRTGELEIMLDRRTIKGDHGMDEGVTDSKLTYQKMLVTIEDIKPTNNYQVPSLLANYLGNSLRYSPNTYYFIDDDEIISKTLKTSIRFIKHSFPCDVHLLNVRTLSDENFPELPSRSALLLLHRQGYDCSIGESLTFCNNTIINVSDLFFNGFQIENIEITSLTGLNNLGHVKNFGNISIEPMDIKTFNVTFKSETISAKFFVSNVSLAKEILLNF